MGFADSEAAAFEAGPRPSWAQAPETARPNDDPQARTFATIDQRRV